MDDDDSNADVDDYDYEEKNDHLIDAIKVGLARTPAVGGTAPDDDDNDNDNDDVV